ncbi:MAG: GIY-YIG nuclease family protein [Patescibacteria group bacterium]
MAWVYILQNNQKRYYIGITAFLPKERLSRHNKGDVASTRNGRPWRIVYIEPASNMKSARVRERKIKSWKSGNAFKKLLSQNSGIV